MEEIINTLTYPITLDIIEDPVQLPCCGKSVSRIPLKNVFKVIKIVLYVEKIFLVLILIMHQLIEHYLLLLKQLN